MLAHTFANCLDKKNMKKTENIYRILALFLIGSLGTITGLQKITDDFIPTWFRQKFSDTYINLFPGSLEISYLLIILLEISIGLFACIAIFRREFSNSSSKSMVQWMFLSCYLLFSILFFGSFLAHDYENGFSDFGYFAFTLFIQNQLFTNQIPND